MPVGKNALKRVTNNGYSKVEVSAPDMENSEVVNSKTQNDEIKEASIKAAPKKNTTPKAKKPATSKPKMVEADATSRPDGFTRYEFGQDLPVHLL